FWFPFFLGLAFPGVGVFGGGSWLWCSRGRGLGLRSGLAGTGIRAGLGSLCRAVQRDEGSQNTGKNERAAHRTSRPIPLRRWAHRKVYRPEDQRSAAAEAGLFKSARPSSFRTATSASLGGPM